MPVLQSAPSLLVADDCGSQSVCVCPVSCPSAKSRSEGVCAPSPSPPPLSLELPLSQIDLSSEYPKKEK